MDRLKRLSTALAKIIVDTIDQMRRAQLPLVASSLSYITILSLIPLVALSLAIFQAFGGLQKIYGVLEPFLLHYLAEGVSEQATTLLKTFVQNAHAGTLGIGGFIGVTITSMGMLSNVEKAINRVWNAPIRRGWVQRISSYWVFITLGPVALAIILGAATSQSLTIAKFFPSSVVTFGITVGFFYCVYKWVPHTTVNTWYALISGFVAAAMFALARTGYEFYLSKAVSYNKLYGSLAAIPIFLLWIYIVWIVILGGAALTAALQGYRNHLSGRQ